MAKVGITSDNNYAGGITYSSQPFILGAANGTAINGGFNFDLPLATVAHFGQNALDFTASTNKSAQDFLGGVINMSQQQVTATSNSALQSINSASTQIADVSRQMSTDSIWRAFLTPAASSGGGGCFITTAICKDSGLPDDCDELTTLRKFRDEYMNADKSRIKLVRQYYAIAPAIVSIFDAMPPKEAKAIYKFLRGEFLEPAIASIKARDFETAMIVYENMVIAALNICEESYEPASTLA